MHQPSRRPWPRANLGELTCPSKPMGNLHVQTGGRRRSGVEDRRCADPPEKPGSRRAQLIQHLDLPLADSIGTDGLQPPGRFGWSTPRANQGSVSSWRRPPALRRSKQATTGGRKGLHETGAFGNWYGQSPGRSRLFACCWRASY